MLYPVCERGWDRLVSLSIADPLRLQPQFAARDYGADNYQMSTRHSQQPAIERLFEEP
jgi:hypothetical protein